MTQGKWCACAPQQLCAFTGEHFTCEQAGKWGNGGLNTNYLSPTDPPTAHHEIVLVKHCRLAGRDGALGGM